jgi:hypothetical protein
VTAWTRTKARPIVGERSGGICEIDGWRPAESLSHRIAVARGGLWAPSGLVHTCGDGSFGRLCHGWLEDHPTWAGEGGWQIRRDPRLPSEVPVFLRPFDLGPGWFTLDDLGNRWRVDPADYGLPLVPAHLPWLSGRPLHTVPWVDPR